MQCLGLRGRQGESGKECQQCQRHFLPHFPHDWRSTMTHPSAAWCLANHRNFLFSSCYSYTVCVFRTAAQQLCSRLGSAAWPLRGVEEAGGREALPHLPHRLCHNFCHVAVCVAEGVRARVTGRGREGV